VMDITSADCWTELERVLVLEESPLGEDPHPWPPNP
jgi:hypothetical protein